MTRRYDQLVQSRTVRRPGLDAAVLRLRPSYRGLALSLDGTGRIGSLDPFTGGAAAILEAARNVACAGGEPLGFTDCLNFGNPEKPEIGWELAESIEGMAQACEALGLPIVSGNVSLYNDTDGRSIHPTPVVGCVGLVPDVRRVPGGWQRGRRDRRSRRPDRRRCPARSYQARYGTVSGTPPRLDLDGRGGARPVRRRRRSALLARPRRRGGRPRRRARRGCAALGRRRRARSSARPGRRSSARGAARSILALPAGQVETDPLGSDVAVRRIGEVGGDAILGVAARPSCRAAWERDGLACAASSASARSSATWRGSRTSRLFALQHRGQESAGIAVSEGGRLTVLRDMGLVAQVFNEQQLQALPGEVAIGHTRYSTTGGVHWSNAQPLVHHGRARTVALGHNGNLTNAGDLRDELVADGIRLGSTSDTEVIAALIARDPAPLPEAVAATMQRLEGAYSVVALVDGTLVTFRDPHGIRPLTLGRIGDDWVVASESCALDLIGADVDRDVRPGEVALAGRGRHPQPPGAARGPRRAPASSSTSTSPGPTRGSAAARSTRARVRMGQRLAEEAPADADLVMPIPDSGTPAAIGFAKASGIPFEEGLIKNRYVGRTFIQPDQELRRQGIRLKFNPLDEVAGQRVVIVDDSIVRGNTMQQLVAMLVRRRRRRGARADLVAAGRLALLLRHRHGRRGRARRRPPVGRGDARAHRRDLARTTSRSRGCSRRRACRRARSAAPASRASIRPRCPSGGSTKMRFEAVPVRGATTLGRRRVSVEPSSLLRSSPRSRAGPTLRSPESCAGR